MRTSRRLSIVALVGAATLAVAPLAPAAAAPAAPDTATTTAADRHHPRERQIILFDGQTTLNLDPAVAAVLADNGVSVTPIRPAEGTSFPIVLGRLDADTLAGRIRHSGGLTFAAGDVELGVRNFVIDTEAGVLTARVAGTQDRIPLLSLDLSAAEIDLGRRTTEIANVGVALTAEAAAALNATFGVTLFTEGLVLGTADVHARSVTVRI